LEIGVAASNFEQVQTSSPNFLIISCIDSLSCSSRMSSSSSARALLEQGSSSSRRPPRLFSFSYFSIAAAAPSHSLPARYLKLLVGRLQQGPLGQPQFRGGCSLKTLSSASAEVLLLLFLRRALPPPQPPPPSVLSVVRASEQELGS
jgi:hypothetical protein